MAYSDYDARYAYHPRHDSYYEPHKSSDMDAYSRHAPAPRTMKNSSQNSSYPSSYRTERPRYAASPPPTSRRDATQHYARRDQRRPRWPPSPSVEDEAVALAHETPSSAGDILEEDSGEARSRGSVDQYPIIEDVSLLDERRFVLVSDPLEDDAGHTERDRRRRSFAERGNMHHLKTDLNEPSVITERKSMPYSYTKPQKESLAPSGTEYVFSPEPITPSSSSAPRSVPARDGWDARDQNARPSKPKHARNDSYKQGESSRSNNRNDVFEDSDVESDSGLLQAPERRSARYSFSKGDLKKDDLRTNVLESQAKQENERRKVPPLPSRDSYSYGSNSSSGSSKHPTPPSHSPRSSTSSINGESRKPRPRLVDTDTTKSSSRYVESRQPSRPSSPAYDRAPSVERAPKLPPRRPASPTTSRPSSRSGNRPPSPLSSSQTLPRSTPRVPITESDWHATYPPTTERSRPARHDRYDTMPVPAPRIDVQSPSPARSAKPANPLPYPVDEIQSAVHMPPEEQYQYDHSYTPITTSPRQPFTEMPIPGSPRERSAPRPGANSRHSADATEMPRATRSRSDSLRSQSSYEGRRERERRAATLSIDRPLPSCPRSEVSAKYNDWYTLENRPQFDLCPSCYEGVFANTPFAVYFAQTRRYERPVERACDFASPWMRLAWLLTIKQRRQTLDLLDTLAAIMQDERTCPGDRELSTDHITWYGIPDQRDGAHVANFALCPRDLHMTEALFPSIKGYFTPLPPSTLYAMPASHVCSLRVSSRRFPKYLDLLVELDAEAQTLNARPNIARFIQLAREHAFKAECARDKPLVRKLWHFIPQLPELTVCQECFDEVVWPAIANPPASSPATASFSAVPIPQMFHRSVQPVPNEDPELGSSCCLYSPRMRRVWEKCVRENDFATLQRRAVDRKRAEVRLGRERKRVLGWMAGVERGSEAWVQCREDLDENRREWEGWE